MLAATVAVGFTAGVSAIGRVDDDFGMVDLHLPWVHKGRGGDAATPPRPGQRAGPRGSGLDRSGVAPSFIDGGAMQQEEVVVLPARVQVAKPGHRRAGGDARAAAWPAATPGGAARALLAEDFREMDRDGDGHLAAADLAARRGLRLAVAERMVQRADRDGDGQLDFAELAEAMLPPGSG